MTLPLREFTRHMLPLRSEKMTLPHRTIGVEVTRPRVRRNHDLCRVATFVLVICVEGSAC